MHAPWFYHCVCPQPVLHCCWAAWVRGCAAQASNAANPDDGPLLDRVEVCEALLSDMVRLGVDLGDVGRPILQWVRNGCAYLCMGTMVATHYAHQVTWLLLEMLLEQSTDCMWTPMTMATAAVCTPLVQAAPSCTRAADDVVCLFFASWWRALAGLQEGWDPHLQQSLAAAVQLTDACMSILERLSAEVCDGCLPWHFWKR